MCFLCFRVIRVRGVSSPHQHQERPLWSLCWTVWESYGTSSSTTQNTTWTASCTLCSSTVWPHAASIRRPVCCWPSRTWSEPEDPPTAVILCPFPKPTITPNQESLIIIVKVSVPKQLLKHSQNKDTLKLICKQQRPGIFLWSLWTIQVFNKSFTKLLTEYNGMMTMCHLRQTSPVLFYIT